MLSLKLLKNIPNFRVNNLPYEIRGIYTSFPTQKNVTARYSPTPKKDFPLTYEMSQKPHHIGHSKGWTSWNSSSFINWSRHDWDSWSIRTSATAVEDIFIRKFMTGTWHGLFVDEILIKRQANLIRIAGIIQRSITPRKMYFLIGYTEELLSYWLQCPVKLELQTVNSKLDVVFKYI